MKFFTILACGIASVEASRYNHASSPITTTKKASKAEDAPLPIVDLGYERHQGNLNSSGHYHNFSNIPYATPPLGDLRFSKPVPINTTSSVINDGSNGHICPQARPDWVSSAEILIAVWAAGLIENIDPGGLTPTPWKEPLAEWQSEDCLLLDVVVPEGVVKASQEDDNFYPLPVMVWLHGGGFSFGHKNQDGSPYGFFNASTFLPGSDPIYDNVIFVTINYRLGAFGFLSSPDDSEKTKPTANAGLYDQALALKWVNQHISKFGGDPERVTVIGESAGASSILHHITSYGGNSPDLNPEGLPRAPFQRAIMQSPTFFPAAHKMTELETYSSFLYLARASSLEDLKLKLSEDLINANKLIVSQAPYAQFTFGPTLDGALVPKPIPRLLAYGDFWRDIDGIMVAHNSHEGITFTDIMTTKNEFVLAEFIQKSLPGLTAEDVTFILEDLYPLPEGDVGIVEQILRVANVTSELSTICNALFLTDAFGDEKNYKYVFDMPPGVHGQDVGYSFYQPPPSDPTDMFNIGKVIPSTVINAQSLQAYIVGFVKEGDPNRGLIEPEFPDYLDGTMILGYKENSSFLAPEGEVRVEQHDPWVDIWTRYRCAWWQETRYWDDYEKDDLEMARNNEKKNGKNAKLDSTWKAEWAAENEKVLKSPAGKGGKNELR